MPALKPRELAASFSTYDHAEAEASLAAVKATEASQRAELALAIRKSFKKGDEQGNGRRLEALVELEGTGALDVIRAVLEDTVEVGGKYSNLRNTALGLMRDHFLGEPSLEASLREAIEIDEYLDIDALYVVLAPYDPARARQLLVAAAERCTPIAITMLARDPATRPIVLGMFDQLMEHDADAFLEALGDVAADPSFAARIAPHAPTVPAAAIAVIAAGDLEHIRALAGRVADKEYAWRAAAFQALAALAPEEGFDRASVLFTAKDRDKRAGRERADHLARTLASFQQPLDARWLAFLTKRLAVEDNAVLRGTLVEALVVLGPEAAKVIISAPRDDKDKHVLAAIPLAVSQLAKQAGTVRGLVEVALKKAKGKHKTMLARALKWLDNARSG